MSQGVVDPPLPPVALWYEAAPRHFDSRVPCWIKALLIAAATVVALMALDRPIAAWAIRTHALPEINVPGDKQDIARELMLLEQWGQVTGSVLVIAAVAGIDKAGRRRALAIAIGCLATVALTYLFKDLIGRSRPNVMGDGAWVWGGPAKGFTQGAAWSSLPSAHTTAAFALSCGLSWFYPRARGLFMGLAAITAAQRVLHHAHFLSDTIAGMGLAVLVTRWTFKAKVAGRLIAAMTPTTRRWWLADWP